MIRMKNVHKAFGAQSVLRGVDLEIREGKITVVMGASGGGKSVLLKHMIGLMRPDRGEIRVYGKDLARLSEEEMAPIRKRMGMLFQDGALFDSLTVEENVAFPLQEHTRLKRDRIRDIVREKLERVGLPGVENRMPSELSGGMRKRVGLARAIALDPEILLFDEPTSGLDPLSADAIDRLIQETQATLGVTVVVISHDVRSILRIADHVAMLYEGKILAQGTPREIRENPHPVLQRFIRGYTDEPGADPESES